MSKTEIIGFIFGIGGVWLTIRKNTWCFPVGLVNVTITAWLVWQQRLYADVLQQVVYFILLVYGWYRWLCESETAEKPVSTSGRNLLIKLAIIFVAASATMGYLLHRYTDASYPYLDSTGTVICFIAQWMIAGKKIENWLLWMVANTMYIAIYLLKDLPLYSLLSAVYLALAIHGMIEWKKMLLQKK